MNPVFNAVVAVAVIGGAIFLGHSPSDDGPAPAQPAAVANQPADDGCDHPNISPGDHPYTQAEVDKLTRMAAAQCRAIVGAFGSPSGDGPPTDNEMCNVLRQVSGDPTATCYHSR